MKRERGLRAPCSPRRLHWPRGFFALDVLAPRGCTVGAMVVERTHRLSMRISEDEWNMLESLADSAGITASDWVRLRIREAYAEQPPKKRK